MDDKLVLAGKRIVVSGAGIAGLAFARAIDREWPAGHPKPQVVLYERSSEKLEIGRDGYTMGIRGDAGSGGLQALKALGLIDQVIVNSTTAINSSQQTPRFWTKDWKLILSVPPPAPPKGLPAASIRLVRHVLRRILLNGLPTDTTVHWNTGCDSADVQPDGSVKVHLSDGSVDHCDLLVAADGANSHVRKQLLPNEGLEFDGVVCFIGTSRFPNGKPELLKEDWGMSLSGQGVPFLTFPVDEHSGVWATSYRAKEPRERVRGEEALRRKDEILDEVRLRGKMFGQPFGQFIEATDPSTLQIFNAQHKYPITHSKAIPNASVVFIGDANHPMSPFSGNGANMALMDAVELGRQLSGASSLRGAIDGFDAESVPRSRRAIDKSWWVIRVLHSQGLAFWLLQTFMKAVYYLLQWKSR